MGNRTPQQTVRAGQFEERLGQLEMDLRRSLAADMATVLAEYHKAWVQPVADRNVEIEERVALLERRTGIAAYRWVREIIRAWREAPPEAAEAAVLELEESAEA